MARGVPRQLNLKTMAKETLYVIWCGVSKSGNTGIILSNRESASAERRTVKIGKKSYKQIILQPRDEASDEERNSFYILLEGDVAADFPQGTSLDAETSQDVISKGPKGTLYAAYL